MKSELDLWASQASLFIHDCFDLARPFLDRGYDGLPKLLRFVAAQLYIDCHLTSESVLLLLREQKEWDAEIICRSVLEGTFKFAYMLQGSEQEILEKVHEYWNVLPEFYRIRHHENAKKVLDAVGDPQAPEWLPIHELLVEDPEIQRIRDENPKSVRQAIEERWSFIGICRAFAKSDNPRLRGFATLTHGYAMSSHQLHKDADGVSLTWERSQRPLDRRVAVTLGHASRLISDVCHFAQWRVLELLRTCRAPVDGVRALPERYPVLFDGIAQAQRHFTQIEYGKLP